MPNETRIIKVSNGIKLRQKNTADKKKFSKTVENVTLNIFLDNYFTINSYSFETIRQL